MAVKNLMEDIIRNTANELIKSDKSITASGAGMDDITAYVLNRIPPRYVSGERGILHGKLESKYHFQQKSDILFLIYEAIGIIKKGRQSSGTGLPEKSAAAISLPHIIGEVLEETTFSRVSDISVMLLYRGKPARMIDSGWKNPYRTHKATMSYFHFWPEYDSKNMGEKSPVQFTLRFSHGKFEEKNINIDLELRSHTDTNISHVVPISLVRVKEGTGLDFLYED